MAIVSGAGGKGCISVRGRAAAVCAAIGRKGEAGAGAEGAPGRARGASATGATRPSGAQARTGPTVSRDEPFQPGQLPPGCCFPHPGDTLDIVAVAPSKVAAPSASAPSDPFQRKNYHHSTVQIKRLNEWTH